MSDMKCPFCQRELQEITTSNPLGLGRIEMAVCKKCMDKGVLHIMPIWDWQEFIRTRKALDVAIDALKDIRCIYTGDQTTRPSTMFGRAASALNKIQELEQKDVK